MRLRRLLPVIAIVVFGGVPAALAVTADPFGAPETADPVFRPRTFFNDIAPFFGADASGNVLLGTIYRDASSDDQFAVYERCGGAPVSWQRTVLTNEGNGILPVGLRVAPNGTAMAMWRVTGGGTTTHYSSVRPPGGTWGAPQTVVSDTGVTFVQFALGDNGDAIAVYPDGNGTPGTYAKVRTAGGTWGAPETIAATTNTNRVAMSPTGAAVVVYAASTPGYLFSRYRPAGGSWTRCHRGHQKQLPERARHARAGVRRRWTDRGGRRAARVRLHGPLQHRRSPACGTPTRR